VTLVESGRGPSPDDEQCERAEVPITGTSTSTMIRRARVKHDRLRVVKTISVRDLRQRWPEAEALLQVEEEIVITRDARPVAKLVRVAERPRPRKRFDPAAHARWQRKVAGGKIARWVDRAVREARDDRRPVRRRR
jgi:antitoxin (DNA-binding transcriptional repressor) of toxin-antitoxin stability system